MSLLNQLRQWRDNQARREGVETFRVFPNAVLDALVGTLPQNKEALLSIKGIKEAKYRKYGATILNIIQEHSNASGAHLEVTLPNNVRDEKQTEGDQTLSVSQFLDGVNMELSGMAARVRGEVSSVDIRERVVYFTLKDSTDESMVQCLIFRHQYEVSGVKIAIGDEIIVEGVPEIYKPSGRLSLKVGVIELAGLGALQKAYEALKLKLEQEGLFAPERKRLLPEFAERIALITSEQGAAIGDFMMNLGAQGIKVDFYPVSVEGKKAVFEIIEAIRFFNRQPTKYDVLVVVRGGGSFESLQAFNTEALTREIATSYIPTLLGIGHEKDITLAALVADVMVSTPTAAAKHLRVPFDAARQLMQHFTSQLPMLFRERLTQTQHTLALYSEALLTHLRMFGDVFKTLKQQLTEKILGARALVQQYLRELTAGEKVLQSGFSALQKKVYKTILHYEASLKQYDPKRVLALGYSLVRRGEKIIKNISETKIGDILDVQLGYGKLTTKVEKIIEE